MSRGAFLYTGLQPHWDTCCRLVVETIRRNLSAAACMDYASPATAQMSEPQSGASCWAVAEISECNPYMSQHLDFRPVPAVTVYQPISVFLPGVSQNPACIPRNAPLLFTTAFSQFQIVSIPSARNSVFPQPPVWLHQPL